MDYTSVSLAVQNGTIFVLNGDVKMVGFEAKAKTTFTKCCQVGNYIEQFDMAGNSLGEWPGWYHWPQDMVAHSKNISMPSALNLKFNLSKVIGPGGELVVSAIGQIDDQGMLAQGLGTYRLSFVSIERFE